MLIFWENPLEITVPADAGWSEGWKLQLIIEMFFVAFYILDLTLNVIASRTLYIHSARGALACGNAPRAFCMQIFTCFVACKVSSELRNLDCIVSPL